MSARFIASWNDSGDFWPRRGGGSALARDTGTGTASVSSQGQVQSRNRDRKRGNSRGLTAVCRKQLEASLFRKAVRPHLDEPPLGNRMVLLREFEAAFDPVEFRFGQLVGLGPQARVVRRLLDCWIDGDEALCRQEGPVGDKLEREGEVVRLMRVGRNGEELRDEFRSARCRETVEDSLQLTLK